jgi:predicted ATPase
LALHFQKARIPEKAIHYLHQAGERAVRLSAYQEGRDHLTRGLALLMTLPESPKRARQELALQLALGMAWMGDIPGPEWEDAYTRARELCQKTGQTAQLSRVLDELSVLHFVRAEHQRARELAEEALSLAQRVKDPLLVALAQWQLGAFLLGLGEHTTAHTHLEQVIAFYSPEQHHRSFVSLRGSDAGTGALAYDSCCLWFLGYPEQALKRSQEALALARELGHPFSLCDVLCYAGCMLSEMRRDALALKEHAEELMRLASEKMASEKIPVWLPEGQRYWGSALVMLGQVDEGIVQIREGLAAIQSSGTWCAMSEALCYLAKAQAEAGQTQEGLATLAEAIAFVERTDQRHLEAELHRLRAELLLLQGNEADAEASLQQAIEVARRQQAKSWELRATTSLARLWQQHGRADEARQALAEIYDWFTEGFETPDLQEARALLKELSQNG